MPSSLADVLVEVLTELAGPVDRTELLHTLVEQCRDLLGAQEVGVLLAGTDGTLAVVSCTSSAPAVLAVLEAPDGPTAEAHRVGETRTASRADTAEWPESLAAQGFSAVVSAPLRGDGAVAGAITCLYSSTLVTAGAVYSMTALARVTTVVLLFAEELESRRSLTDQLQTALESRVVIEQAKGVLAACGGVGLDEAFARLRRYSRAHGLLLHDVASEVVRRAEAGEAPGPVG